MKILEVGAGQFPLQSAFHTDVTRAGNLDLLCDCQQLPFVDNAFDLVYASHVLEHVPSPLFALREFKRVGKTTFLRVPNAMNMAYRVDHNGGTTNHFYSWNKATFSNLLSNVYSFVDVGQTIRLLPNHRFRKKLLVYAVTAFSCRNELTAYCK